MAQAIHHLLTGEAYGGTGPLALAVLGGVATGPDVGYGPARLLSPQDVRAVAAALAETSFDAIWKRVDPTRMGELDIYPQIWDEPEEELRDEVKTYFDGLVACYASAAARGDAMLLALT